MTKLGPCQNHAFETDEVDKGWLSGLYWKGKYDDLMRDYQELVHTLEELKSEVDSRHRNESGAQRHFPGGNEKP